MYYHDIVGRVRDHIGKASLERHSSQQILFGHRLLPGKVVFSNTRIYNLKLMRRIIDYDWSIFCDLRLYDRYDFYCRARIRNGKKYINFWSFSA
ncbi:hypothetical protein ALC56_12608 [Trachymyrmex septentrionalis]|uniref:Uncharacterized protein n=1 Tax=Trachymyrmex septentrionalis TaxID=34720 RepID=A0A195EYB7_9HYME|nr:hypothetical protein ALC56_12608 [Trachymyrmex septentrionalis]